MDTGICHIVKLLPLWWSYVVNRGDRGQELVQRVLVFNTVLYYYVFYFLAVWFGASCLWEVSSLIIHRCGGYWWGTIPATGTHSSKSVSSWCCCFLPLLLWSIPDLNSWNLDRLNLIIQDSIPGHFPQNGFFWNSIQRILVDYGKKEVYICVCML